MFANSPVGAGTDRLASRRSLIWSQIDPTRTRPVPTGSIDDWIDYVLDAHVLLIRTDDGAIPLTDGTTLRTWITSGHAGCFPDESDIRYHLTTLFPPVRPRGWLELRMIDAVPSDARRVAVALTSILAEPSDAVCDIAGRSGALPDLWLAAQCGLADPVLHGVAIELFDAAAHELSEGRSPLTNDVIRWLDSMVRYGRTPADT